MLSEIDLGMKKINTAKTANIADYDLANSARQFHVRLEQSYEIKFPSQWKILTQQRKVTEFRMHEWSKEVTRFHSFEFNGISLSCKTHFFKSCHL